MYWLFLSVLKALTNYQQGNELFSPCQNGPQFYHQTIFAGTTHYGFFKTTSISNNLLLKQVVPSFGLENQIIARCLSLSNYCIDIFFLCSLRKPSALGKKNLFQLETGFTFCKIEGKLTYCIGKLEVMAQAHLELVHTCAPTRPAPDLEPHPPQRICKHTCVYTHTWLALIQLQIHAHQTFSSDGMRVIKEWTFSLYFPRILSSCFSDLATPGTHLSHSNFLQEALKATGDLLSVFQQLPHTQMGMWLLPMKSLHKKGCWEERKKKMA